MTKQMQMIISNFFAIMNKVAKNILGHTLCCVNARSYIGESKKFCEAVLLAVRRFRTLVDNTSFPDSSIGKEYTCNAGDPSSIPGLGRSPGEGIGYPLQYSWISCGFADKESMWSQRVGCD